MQHFISAVLSVQSCKHLLAKCLACAACSDSVEAPLQNIRVVLSCAAHCFLPHAAQFRFADGSSMEQWGCCMKGMSAARAAPQRPPVSHLPTCHLKTVSKQLLTQCADAKMSSQLYLLTGLVMCSCAFHVKHCCGLHLASSQIKIPSQCRYTLLPVHRRCLIDIYPVGWTIL